MSSNWFASIQFAFKGKICTSAHHADSLALDPPFCAHILANGSDRAEEILAAVSIIGFRGNSCGLAEVSVVVVRSR